MTGLLISLGLRWWWILLSVMSFSPRAPQSPQDNITSKHIKTWQLYTEIRFKQIRDQNPSNKIYPQERWMLTPNGYGSYSQNPPPGPVPGLGHGRAPRRVATATTRQQAARPLAARPAFTCGNCGRPAGPLSSSWADKCRLSQSPARTRTCSSPWRRDRAHSPPRAPPRWPPPPAGSPAWPERRRKCSAPATECTAESPSRRLGGLLYGSWRLVSMATALCGGGRGRRERCALVGDSGARALRTLGTNCRRQTAAASWSGAGAAATARILTSISAPRVPQAVRSSRRPCRRRALKPRSSSSSMEASSPVLRATRKQEGSSGVPQLHGGEKRRLSVQKRIKKSTAEKSRKMWWWWRSEVLWRSPVQERGRMGMRTVLQAGPRMGPHISAVMVA